LVHNFSDFQFSLLRPLSPTNLRSVPGEGEGEGGLRFGGIGTEWDKGSTVPPKYSPKCERVIGGAALRLSHPTVLSPFSPEYFTCSMMRFTAGVFKVKNWAKREAMARTRAGKRWKTSCVRVSTPCPPRLLCPSARSCHGFGKHRRIGLDSPHGFRIVNPFVAVGTFVEFKFFDGVDLPLILARPLPSHLLDLGAAARRALCDAIHNRGRLEGPLGGYQEVICVLAGVGNEFSLAVDGQTVQIGAFDDVQPFPGPTTMGADGSNGLVDCHGVKD
jgi:hypothetical protein